VASVGIRASIRGVRLTAFGQPLLATLYKTAREEDILCVHKGDLTGDAVPVRLHSGCLPGETLGGDRCDCGWQLRHAVAHIAASARGVVVYVPREDGRGVGLETLLRSYELMDDGMTSAEAFKALGERVDKRDYSNALAALLDLGVHDVALITNNPGKMAAIEGAGLRLRARIPSVMPAANGRIVRLLREKRELGHLIDRSFA